jgi:RNA polymerase sigma-70 factor (ECF subfamily)
VITLRDVEGYDTEEACSVLDISPGKQRVLLHRACAAVRAPLDDYFAAASFGGLRPVR